MLVQLEYRPDTVGDTLAGELLMAVTAPCADTLRLAIAGHGIDQTTTFTLRWERDSGEVGSVRPLRLTIEQKGEPEGVDTLLLRTRLLFDATVLIPIGVRAVAPGVTASIEDDVIAGVDRRVTLALRGVLPAAGTLAELDVRVALGRADSTRLAFDSVELRRAETGAGLVVGGVVDGLFRVLGICRVGGARLIAIEGFSKLGASRPNPIIDRATIEFETIEAGRTRLVMSDAAGRVVAVLVDAELQPGIHQAGLDARALPAGVYFMTLTTATEMVRSGVVVLK